MPPRPRSVPGRNFLGDLVYLQVKSAESPRSSLRKCRSPRPAGRKGCDDKHLFADAKAGGATPSQLDAFPPAYAPAVRVACRPRADAGSRPALARYAVAGLTPPAGLLYCGANKWRSKHQRAPRVPTRHALARRSSLYALRPHHPAAVDAHWRAQPAGALAAGAAGRKDAGREPLGRPDLWPGQERDLPVAAGRAAAARDF